MKKPTGKSGSFRFGIKDSGEASGEFRKIGFPDEKDDIEEVIVSRFIMSAKEKFKEFFFISQPRKNELDDFDFTVKTQKGEAYLELMEIAPLDLYKAGYEKAPKTYDRCELAEYVVSKVVGKSENYPNNLKRELFLLLYVTDFKFSFSDTTIQLLRYFITLQPVKFDVIFLYTPLDNKDGVVNWIHPMDKEEFNGFDPEKYRGKVINLDTEGFTVIKEK